MKKGIQEFKERFYIGGLYNESVTSLLSPDYISCCV